jgi:hypothetical protein
MYSIVPFTAGAVIVVGILSAFAPMSIIPIDESPVITRAQAAPSSGALSAPPGKSGPSDIKGVGLGDGSTGPTRPSASTADSGDANKATRDSSLRHQRRGQIDPVQPAPATR